MIKKSILWGASVAISILTYSMIVQWITAMSQHDWDVLMAKVGTFGATFLWMTYTIAMLALGALIYHKVVSGSLDASKFRLNSSRIQLNDTRRDQIRYKMLETFFGLSDDITDIPQMADNPEDISILPHERKALSSGQNNQLASTQNNGLSYYTIDDMTDSEDDFNFSDFETEL